MQEGISAIFEQAGCGTPAVRSLLGEGGVSEGNMMQYLGILEQRTNEILQVLPPPTNPPAKPLRPPCCPLQMLTHHPLRPLAVLQILQPCPPPFYCASHQNCVGRGDSWQHHSLDCLTGVA